MPKERQYPAQGHTGLEPSPLAAGPALPAPDLKNRLKSTPWPEGGSVAVTWPVPNSTSPSFSGAIHRGFTEAKSYFPSGSFLFGPNNDLPGPGASWLQLLPRL